MWCRVGLVSGQSLRELQVRVAPKAKAAGHLRTRHQPSVQGGITLLAQKPDSEDSDILVLPCTAPMFTPLQLISLAFGGTSEFVAVTIYIYKP